MEKLKNSKCYIYSCLIYKTFEDIPNFCHKTLNDDLTREKVNVLTVCYEI